MPTFTVQQIDYDGDNRVITFDFQTDLNLYSGLIVQIVNFFTQFGETTCDFQRILSNGTPIYDQRITKKFPEGTITDQLLLDTLELDVIRIVAELEAKLLAELAAQQGS